MSKPRGVNLLRKSALCNIWKHKRKSLTVSTNSRNSRGRNPHDLHSYMCKFNHRLFIRQGVGTDSIHYIYYIYYIVYLVSTYIYVYIYRYKLQKYRSAYIMNVYIYIYVYIIIYTDISQLLQTLDITSCILHVICYMYRIHYNIHIYIYIFYQIYFTIHIYIYICEYSL